MILAHLVGEQTLPNLLAALAVAPTYYYSVGPL